MQNQILQPKTMELSKKDLIKIPTIIKNKVLMAPGPWNGTHYSATEIKRAFDNTNWQDKDVTSLILDHADKPLSVHDWVGWVKNPRMTANNLIGDLEIYDESVLVKLLTGKMKCGISPRVKGMEHNEEFRNFTFENFSIVSNPAVKKAYINLSQSNNLKGGLKMTEKELQEDEESVEEVSAEETEEPAEEKPAEEKELRKNKDDEEKKIKKKKKYPSPDEEEEMSDEELLEITQLSAWTDFVAKMKKKDPKMGFKAIAVAYKKKGKEMEQLEEMNEADLLKLSSDINYILRKKKKDDEDDEEEEMTQAEKKLLQEVKELRDRMDLPDSKTVQETKELSGDSKYHDSGDLAMAGFLQEINGTGRKFITQ